MAFQFLYLNQHIARFQTPSYSNTSLIICSRQLSIVSSSDQPRPLIVGSVGPYGASLHDASEYTGSYAATTSQETMREWHRPRIEALVEAGVDLLALETIPCKSEAEMLVELIKEYPAVKAWLCFSCNVRFFYNDQTEKNPNTKTILTVKNYEK